MLLTLENVAHAYEARPTFTSVSLEVSAGSVTLLAGRNGAGKTTLLGIMAGLVRPSAGRVRRSPDARAAVLGHRTCIYPNLSARENLVFWSSLAGAPSSDAAVDAMLERVELGPFAEEPAGRFSRGMAQRLNLARVLLLEAGILLLDEPATGLDRRSTEILLREIAQARARGAGVVWITHTPAEDRHRADRVALLARQRLAWYGPAREFSPDTDDTAGKIGKGEAQPC